MGRWEERATEGVEEVVFRSANMETGERACRSMIWASSVLSGSPCYLKGRWAVDMGVVCPQDVKKMLLRKARNDLLEEMGSQARV